MANLIARNEKLCSLFEPPAADVVAIGRPLAIHYLYFSLRHDRGRQRLMISTFTKAEEQKRAAAEAVNFYNPRARFDEQGVFRLLDFGAQYYGHPLCYYTRSYLGETIRLTTKVMELDKLDRRAMRALRAGLAQAAILPVFTEYLAYLSFIDAGFRVAEKLINFFNRDDAIIESHNLDLHFRRTNARQLQAGRVVCIPGAEDGEFAESEAWHLAPNNRLIESATGREYERGSYFVLDVKPREHPAYDKFEYFQQVAELLELTNRSADPREVLDIGVEMAKSYQDYRLIGQLEDCLIVPPRERDTEKVTAMFRLLTPRSQRLYEGRLRAALG